MFAKLDRIRFHHVVWSGIGLVAVLMSIGLATREDMASKPYLKVAGSGFIFNYRVADAFYGFTAVVQRPVKAFSQIEATFENPAGGPPIAVSQVVTPRTDRYAIRTPPLRGIEKDRPYLVTVRLVQNGDRQVLFDDNFTVASQMSDAVMPPEPLTIGPGYTRNPDLPKEWQVPKQD